MCGCNETKIRSYFKRSGNSLYDVASQNDDVFPGRLLPVMVFHLLYFVELARVACHEL